MSGTRSLLTPRDSEQTVTLPRILKITGKVTDAATGQPVEQFTAMPVVEHRPGFLMVERNRAKAFSDGTYEIQGDRTDVSYRVRIEADGYRSAMSDLARRRSTDCRTRYPARGGPAAGRPGRRPERPARQGCLGLSRNQLGDAQRRAER